ncbi:MULTISPECIES: penicillin-binding protein 2 [unclassified Streptomyces]|uniref:penicillin-binding protein 2 n=1 Tax=Streptomyces TaxID=1883 RepID=UPI0001C1CBD6|nr:MULTISPECIES: penicillin-binding protein 2 [unclassified Streptomyces]MYR66461.1 penicillin-binding protein 2 [Streptomyces sp. SID4939]MYS01724.1 penicillin-binding protein 2 [Streptomyces sp. SID4940]MYT64213.1 penicillin-binding protein 2 [Streptomyces sp. SID8357]MYT87026.1 penicillin-binding protein 2 [Streptomyces sp. SID8360]MYU34481.1 penicillin-binding protein 2 [Streptomyces sp. SID8358]MYW37411.1 penicillin-binding protein 2 [Streptomyces sp. SID1]
MSNIPETGRTQRVQIRLVVIQILVFSLLLTLGGRLWYLQIRNGQEYTDEAKNNHVQQVVQPAVRGSILDARGVPLADNETRLVVSASRTELMKMKDDGVGVLTRLAEVLDMKPKDVQDKVRLCDAKTPQPCWNGSPYQPIPVTDEATTQQALQIRERAEDFPGITAEPTAVRRYAAPGKANTAQVLGYLSPVTDEELTKAQDTDSPYLRSDQVGRSGLERTYDKELRGKAGVTRYEVDNLGRVIGEAQNDEAQPGASVVTSIDARVQAVAEYELDQAMKAARKEMDRNTNEFYKADSGAVVVMEAKTGRVVSMASLPTYDPNSWVGGISAKDYAELTGKKSNFPLLNRAIQGTAAPGSIFKVISSTAAVNAGYPFDGNYPCPSSYSIGNQTFKNFESQGYGNITIGRALEVSCDTVYYGIAHKEWQKDGGNKPKKNANDWFYKTAHQFGLGKETGIDLPNEVAGRVPDRQWKQDFYDANRESWCKQGKKDGTYVEQLAYEGCAEGYKMRAGDSVNYSIGQGDTLVTPIQMATIYAAISNGGTLYDPTVGKAIVSGDGRTVQEIEPQAHGKLPFTGDTRDKIDQALAGVATQGSAAWRFGGWPQDKIPMHAKTGTAEVYGKQTTSWFATYTKDYSIVMTISQGGTGSGASGPAVRNIYNAIYGLDGEGKQDLKKALLPQPQKALPKITPDGSIVSPKIKPYTPEPPADEGTQALALAVAPGRRD